MAEQQLTNYIKEQLRAGAKPEDIKKILLNGGWPEADVESAMKDIEMSVSTQKTTAQAANIPAALNVQQGQGKPVPREASFPQEKEIERAEREAKKESTGYWKWMYPEIYLQSKFIAASVGALVVLVVIGYLIFRNTGSPTATNQAATAPAAVNQANVSRSPADAAFRDLFSLKLATTTYGTTTVVYPFADKENTVTLGGSLGIAFSGNKLRYAIYDLVSGLFVPIANSDSVDLILKPLLGTMITVSGTHAAGSREITITSLNGKAL